jgi:hypothetical protein
MSEVPEYGLPYPFICQEDTYYMAINYYLGEVVDRMSKGFSLKQIIRADARKSIAWKEEVSRETRRLTE